MFQYRGSLALRKNDGVVRKLLEENTVRLKVFPCVKGGLESWIVLFTDLVANDDRKILPK